MPPLGMLQCQKAGATKDHAKRRKSEPRAAVRYSESAGRFCCSALHREDLNDQVALERGPRGGRAKGLWYALPFTTTPKRDTERGACGSASYSNRMGRRASAEIRVQRAGADFFEEEGLPRFLRMG